MTGREKRGNEIQSSIPTISGQRAREILMSSPASRSSRSNEIEFPKSYRVLRNRVKSNVRISTILTSRTKIYNLSIVGSISVYNSLVIYDVRYYIYVWYFLDRYFYRVLLSRKVIKIFAHGAVFERNNASWRRNFEFFKHF